MGIKVLAMSLGMLHVITTTSIRDDDLSHPIKISGVLMLAFPFAVFEVLYESIKRIFFSDVTASSSFPYLFLPIITFIVLSIEIICLDYFFESFIKPFLDSKRSFIRYSSGVGVFSYLNMTLQITLVILFNLKFYQNMYSNNLTISQTSQQVK